MSRRSVDVRGGLRLDGLVKRFDDVTAVAGVDLELPPGKLISFLGPSGCGKTTMLRMIAGLEHPTEGRIFLDDEDITDRPAYTRDIGMVFQSLALFPHLNVAGNVGLRPADPRGGEGPHLLARGRAPDARLARGDGRSAHPAALRGPAPARGDRPRAGAGAPALPAGRAAVRARCEPARAAPGGAPAAPAAAGDHDDHRHARPAGGDDDVGSRRRDERRAHRTGRARRWRSTGEPGSPFVAGFIGRTNLLRGEASGDGSVSVAGRPFDVAGEADRAGEVIDLGAPGGRAARRGRRARTERAPRHRRVRPGSGRALRVLRGLRDGRARDRRGFAPRLGAGGSRAPRWRCTSRRMRAWSWCRERAGAAVGPDLRRPRVPGGDARDLLPDPVRDHGGDELLPPDRGRLLRTGVRARRTGSASSSRCSSSEPCSRSGSASSPASCASSSRSRSRTSSRGCAGARRSRS